MVSENLRQWISHWLRLLAQLSICHREGGWMASFHLHLCWLCVPMVVCLCACHPMRRLNGCSSRIVELEGSSSYTLIMALCWRIPEASSLIDSSVPFLPRPRYAESRYCPTKDGLWCTQASKQPGSHSYALCTMHSMYSCCIDPDI